MEEQIQAIVESFRSADDSQYESLRNQLVEIAQAYGVSNMVTFLESAKRAERLEVQWELEDVIDILEPPKQDKKPDDDEDDPAGRHLRMSELELVYNDPRGIRLFKSKVDDRWMLMQLDPRSGQMMQQELNAEQGAHITSQLGGSPYWLKNPNQ